MYRNVYEQMQEAIVGVGGQFIREENLKCYTLQEIISLMEPNGVTLALIEKQIRSV